MVWFFDKPTIGYCPKCDKIATWSRGEGLHCPKCKTTDVSIFEWDENSPYPEDVK